MIYAIYLVIGVLFSYILNMTSRELGAEYGTVYWILVVFLWPLYMIWLAWEITMSKHDKEGQE